MKVMLCTAVAKRDIIERVHKLNIVGFIKKPFLPNDFVKILRPHIRMVRRENILLVDDDEDDLEYLQRIITKNFPHEVIPADSCIVAMDVLRNMDVRLVISATDMPMINGLRLLAFIRETKRTKDIPFIFTGEFEDPDMPDDAAEFGFQGQLPKPFNEFDIVSKVTQCCY